MPQQIDVPGLGVVEFPDGMTDEQIASAIKANAPATTSDVVKDVVKSGGIGAARGVIGLAGLPGDVGSLISTAADKVGIPGSVKDATKAVVSKLPVISGLATGPTSEQLQKGIESYTGEFYQPKTTAGEYAKTVGEFLPAAAMGPGGMARRVATQAVLPGLASEAAGQATEGTGAEPWARMGGAMAGALAPSAIGRAVTPMPVDRTRQAMVDILRNEGVDVSAGQATGREALRYAESTLGNAPGAGGKAGALQTRQGEQFTGAALRRIGEGANRATPEVIEGAIGRIGKTFDDLAARNTLAVDRQFADDMARTQDDYHLLANPLQRKVVDDVVDDVIGVVQRGNGTVSGDVYQTMRSRLDKAARGAGQDVQLKDAMYGIRNALDDAMERSIAQSGNADDLNAWREARRQYRNFLVIERAATAPGENAALGIISPAQLRAAVVGQNRRAYGQGHGDFADLARAGDAVMRPMPQSGTAPRMYAQTIPAIAGGMIGHALGGAPGAGAGVLAGAAGSAVAPAVMGRALMSRPMQSYLGNQVATPYMESLDPRRAALIQLLMAEPRLQLQSR